MAKIRPFRGFRPVSNLASEIASLPYDVMDTEEARAEIETHPDSFLTVTKSEAVLPKGTEPYDPEVYARARENLERYAKEGKMKQDPSPCFYIYRQRRERHIQIGVVATVAVEDYRKGVVKRHELTRTDKEEDRVRHILGTKAQTGPVFLTYHGRPEIDSYILKLMSEHTPAFDFIADDGVRNTLYVIENPLEVQELTKLFAPVERFYIADGHHRCAGAMRVAATLEKEGGKNDPGAEYKYFQAVIFPDHMMNILDYNRVVKDLAGYNTEEFLQAVEEKFTVKPVEKAYRPQTSHSFGMYLKGQWYALTAREGTFAAQDAIASLDVSILQANILTPLLKIGDPRTDKRIGFVGGVRGLSELEKRVNNGSYAVAFAMFPTRMEEVMAAADADQIMPPKSTWFEPKLRDGIVVHLLEDL